MTNRLLAYLDKHHLWGFAAMVFLVLLLIIIVNITGLDLQNLQPKTVVER